MSYDLRNKDEKIEDTLEDIYDVLIVKKYAGDGEAGTVANPYMNAIAEALESGKKLYLSSDRFEEENQIVCDEDYTFINGLPDAVVVEADSYTDNAELFAVTGDYFRAKNFSIIGNGLYGGTSDLIFGLNGVTNGILDNLICTNVRYDFVEIYASSIYCDVINCYLSSLTPRPSGGAAIEFESGASYCSAINNKIFNFRSGIYFDPNSGNVVKSCNITDNKIRGCWNAIWIKDTDEKTEDILIKGNIINGEGAGSFGIRVGNTDNIIIVGNTVKEGGANAGLELSADITGIIANNDFTGYQGSPSSGLTIVNNIGINPIGVISTPIDTTNKKLHYNGDSATVIDASTVYEVLGTPCRIISGDSSNTDCSITIKDQDDNSIETGLSTYDGWLEPGWTINWGAFTGTDPVIVVIFK